MAKRKPRTGAELPKGYVKQDWEKGLTSRVSYEARQKGRERTLSKSIPEAIKKRTNEVDYVIGEASKGHKPRSTKR